MRISGRFRLGTRMNARPGRVTGRVSGGGSVTPGTKKPPPSERLRAPGAARGLRGLSGAVPLVEPDATVDGGGYGDHRQGRQHGSASTGSATATGGQQPIQLFLVRSRPRPRRRLLRPAQRVAGDTGIRAGDAAHVPGVVGVEGSSHRIVIVGPAPLAFQDGRPPPATP